MTTEDTMGTQPVPNDSPKTNADILEELKKDIDDILPNAVVTSPVTVPKPKKLEEKPITVKNDPLAVHTLKLRDIQLPALWNRDKLGDLTGLVQSLKTMGQLTALSVRPLKNGKYELVDGRRRFAALTEAGMTEALVTVKNISDEDAYFASTVANVVRADHTLSEYMRIIDHYINVEKRTVKGIAAGLGWKEVRVGQYVRLRNLPEEVQKLIAQDKLEFSGARALCSLSMDDKRDVKFLGKILEKLKDGKVTSTTISDSVAYYLEHKNAVDNKDPNKAEKKKGGKKKKEAELYDYEDTSYVKSMKMRKPSEVGKYMNAVQDKLVNARTQKKKDVLEGVLIGLSIAAGHLDEF